jgi:hypothetical protein
MIKELIGAYTKPGGSYPGYINASRSGDRIVLTVRGDPTHRDAAFICGYARDKGQIGRCTPGDEHCNNYCNMAPEKGPMQDHPKRCEQIIEAKTVTLSLSADEWVAVVAVINGGQDAIR